MANTEEGSHEWAADLGEWDSSLMEEMWKWMEKPEFFNPPHEQHFGDTSMAVSENPSGGHIHDHFCLSVGCSYPVELEKNFDNENHFSATPPLSFSPGSEGSAPSPPEIREQSDEIDRGLKRSSADISNDEQGWCQANTDNIGTTSKRLAISEDFEVSGTVKSGFVPNEVQETNSPTQFYQSSVTLHDSHNSHFETMITDVGKQGTSCQEVASTDVSVPSVDIGQPIYPNTSKPLVKNPYKMSRAQTLEFEIATGLFRPPTRNTGVTPPSYMNSTVDSAVASSYTNTATNAKPNHSTGLFRPPQASSQGHTSYKMPQVPNIIFRPPLKQQQSNSIGQSSPQNLVNTANISTFTAPNYSSVSPDIASYEQSDNLHDGMQFYNGIWPPLPSKTAAISTPLSSTAVPDIESSDQITTSKTRPKRSGGLFRPPPRLATDPATHMDYNIPGSQAASSRICGSAPNLHAQAATAPLQHLINDSRPTGPGDRASLSSSGINQSAKPDQIPWSLRRSFDALAKKLDEDSTFKTAAMIYFQELQSTGKLPSFMSSIDEAISLSLALAGDNSISNKCSHRDLKGFSLEQVTTAFRQLEQINFKLQSNKFHWLRTAKYFEKRTSDLENLIKSCQTALGQSVGGSATHVPISAGHNPASRSQPASSTKLSTIHTSDCTNPFKAVSPNHLSHQHDIPLPKPPTEVSSSNKTALRTFQPQVAYTPASRPINHNNSEIINLTLDDDEVQVQASDIVDVLGKEVGVGSDTDLRKTCEFSQDADFLVTDSETSNDMDKIMAELFGETELMEAESTLVPEVDLVTTNVQAFDGMDEIDRAFHAVLQAAPKEDLDPRSKPAPILRDIRTSGDMDELESGTNAELWAELDKRSHLGSEVNYEAAVVQTSHNTNDFERESEKGLIAVSKQAPEVSSNITEVQSTDEGDELERELEAAMAELEAEAVAEAEGGFASKIPKKSTTGLQEAGQIEPNGFSLKAFVAKSWSKQYGKEKKPPLDNLVLEKRRRQKKNTSNKDTSKSDTSNKIQSM